MPGPVSSLPSLPLRIAILVLLSIASACTTLNEPPRRPRPASATQPPDSLPPDPTSVPTSNPPPPARPEFWGMPSPLDPRAGRTEVSLLANGIPLGEALRELTRQSSLEGVTGSPDILERPVEATIERQPLRDVLAHLERQAAVRFEHHHRTIHVRDAADPAWALLAYPLPHGLIRLDRPVDFDSIQQLSFISRTQHDPVATASIVDSRPVARVAAPNSLPGATPSDLPPAAPSLRRATPTTHLELFLQTIPTIVAWPEGSSWHFDPSTNQLVIRSIPATLLDLRRALDLLCRPPIQVEIEARFVELSEDFSRDLGAEFELTEDYAVRRTSGDPQTALGPDTGTRFAIPDIIPTSPDGARLSILGLLTQPRFRALLRALESDGRAEVISSPSVTTVNNVRATLAITTNLPYVEAYRPIVDRELVASEGISRAESSVALVAEINDSNFTGIVLSVLPSVGHQDDTIHLALQPVIRDQVDAITISSGAVIEGVPTPAITRPVIETRFIDAQLAIPSGGTIALGGLESSHDRTITTGVPLLSAIPILGRLFRRETTIREKRELMILVTARVVR